MSKNRIPVLTVLVAAMGLSLSAQAGNGAPSGAHYNLNILGKTTCSGDDLKNTNRNNIQVLLTGGQKAVDINGTTPLSIDKKNKIYLEEAGDGTFSVLDGNACDGDGALFRLPAPGTYEIWARALGKPGGEATMTTCYTVDGTIYCSTENVFLWRQTGQSSFKDVTRELTTTYIGGNRVQIFNNSLYNYFWNYDNNGLRLAQLRFYKQ